MTANGEKIRAVLIGGSGYAGFEVLRWLGRHPQVEVVGVFGPESELGAMDAFYPLLTKQVALAQERFEPGKLAELEAHVALLCVPHKVAMSYVPALRDAGLRVIDWSADYRLGDCELYEKWYCPHEDPANLPDAVYGLPEYYAARIAEADLVANPGCYPTCTILPLAPLIRAGLIEANGIIVNAVSGVSGAGRKPNLKFHFPERNENFEPYGIGGHRHQPEMEATLRDITRHEVELMFQPHLAPMDRGMFCSIYARPTGSIDPSELSECLRDAYADAPFVRVRTEFPPAAKYVSTTNFCDVYATAYKGRVVVFSALDNLIKGASGQAIQNLNLMFDLDETAGLY